MKMKDKELDSLKEAFRRKVDGEPISADTDVELWEKVRMQIEKPELKTVHRSFTWYYVAAAAILFVIISAGIGIYNYSTSENLIAVNPPAESSALSDNSQQTDSVESEKITSGKEISEPVKENISVKDASVPEFDSEQTGNVVKEISLADGSSVTINKNSVIESASDFKSNRTVRLNGEAYFDVAKDKKYPFSVLFSDYRLVVVGTKFNIRNIESENFSEVTVKEGIVRVSDLKHKFEKELHAGDQLILSEGAAPVICRVDAANFISWKTGVLNFDKARMEEVVTIVSRKFNKEIDLASELKNCRFTGDLQDLSFEEALQIITMSTSSKVEKSESKLFITGKGCD
jgi:transmembrane sensor